MALIDSGILGGFPTVEECRSHPFMNKKWGCDAIAQINAGGKEIESPCVPSPTIGGVTFKIYRHPFLVFGDTERLWKHDYRVKTKYGTRLEYDEFHPCYIYAEEHYENFLKGIENAKRS